MEKVLAIRPFVGSRDFGTSRAFYRELGFEEFVISKDMSVFSQNGTSFYLQDYYVEDWINNTMMLLEVESADRYWEFLSGLQLADKYPGVRLVPIRRNDWGDECMLIDPSGVLWHFAAFH